MRYIWLTDIHFDHLSRERTFELIEMVRGAKGDAVLITGDIAEAGRVLSDLEAFERAIRLPVYFVYGNHDFFGGWTAMTRDAATNIGIQNGNLIYLTGQSKPIELTQDVGLIGDDGWGDARYGDYAASTVKMPDQEFIWDFCNLTKPQIGEKLNQYGYEAANRLAPKLDAALKKYQHTILLTHIPPFPEACLHDGLPTLQVSLPFYTCKAIGDLILKKMSARPNRRLTVYCGHSHSKALHIPLANVTIHTGAAEYKMPQIAGIIEL